MTNAEEFWEELQQECFVGNYDEAVLGSSAIELIQQRDVEHVTALNRLIESLHKIASWNEGEIVDGAFDSPNDAREARAALGAIGIWGPPATGHREGVVKNLSELLVEAANWAIPTFPLATPDSWCAHIQKEAAELRDEPRSLIEMADILILIGGLAVKQGFAISDLENAVRRKLAVNKKRVWGAPDSDGVVEHVRES